MSSLSEVSPPKSSPPPVLRHPASRPTPLAAHQAAALVNWFESRVRPQVGSGHDQVIVPILGATGLRDLTLVVDCNGAHTVVCDDRDVIAAALACRDAAALDGLLEDIRFDVDAEQLFNFTTRWDDVPVVLFTMARVAERILDRAANLPTASVVADAAFAATLGATLNARMLVTVGDLLFACERQVLVDVFAAWARLSQLLGRQSPEQMLAPGSERQVWTATRLVRHATQFDAIRFVVRQMLQAVDGPDALSAWLRADAVLRGFAEVECEGDGFALVARLRDADEAHEAHAADCRVARHASDWNFDQDARDAINAEIDLDVWESDTVEMAARLGHLGRVALGQTRLQ